MTARDRESDARPTSDASDLSIHGLIDRLVERFSAGEHKLTAMRAREEYFERAGKVFDDDAELFDGRMASFLEWYVLERPLDDGAPPVVHALRDARLFSAVERRGLAQLAATSTPVSPCRAVTLSSGAALP